MNVQYSLIQELMIYNFKMGYNLVQVTKNVCYVKEEGTVVS